MHSLLNRLRAITPRDEYVRWSKAAILSAPRPVRWYDTLLAVAFQAQPASSAIGLLVAVLGGGILLARSGDPTLVDFQRIIAEAEESTIEITMAELQYYAATKSTIDTALTEAAASAPGQLSPSLLREEQAAAVSAGSPLRDADIAAGLNALAE